MQPSSALSGKDDPPNRVGDRHGLVVPSVAGDTAEIRCVLSPITKNAQHDSFSGIANNVRTNAC
jgi:hypothetical protein